MKNKIVIIFLVTLAVGILYFFWNIQNENNGTTYYKDTGSTLTTTTSQQPTGVSGATITNGIIPPQSKLLGGMSWVGQTFNNCSSVGLMIALSKWGIVDTQEEIAKGTRPWNNPKGNNDDKSVTLYELADYAREKHGVLVYVRPNGNLTQLKTFIANDIPVLTRTLMYPDDDIVHYRVVKGYNDTKKIITETDGYYGKSHEYTYDEWMHLWKDFNYSYAIVVKNDKKELVEKLLGEELDEKLAWQHAKERAEKESKEYPTDLRNHYNVVTALYYLGDYEGTIREFEKLEGKLTRRKLWYQMEPIEAYFKLGKYDKVLQLADSIINDNNKSVSELYVMKGNIFESRGDIPAAKAEYQKAVFYNESLQSAKDALAKVMNVQ